MNCSLVIAAQRSNGFQSSNCHCIRVRLVCVGRQKRFWSQLNNSKNVCQWEPIGTHVWAVEWTHPDPQHSPNPRTGGRKVPISNFSQMIGGQQKCQWSTLAVCEVTPWTIVQLSPKPQMGNCRSSTICDVVEQPDHNCFFNFVYPLLWGCNQVISAQHFHIPYLLLKDINWKDILN